MNETLQQLIKNEDSDFIAIELYYPNFHSKINYENLAKDLTNKFTPTLKNWFDEETKFIITAEAGSLKIFIVIITVLSNIHSAIGIIDDVKNIAHWADVEIREHINHHDKEKTIIHIHKTTTQEINENLISLASDMASGKKTPESVSNKALTIAAKINHLTPSQLSKIQNTVNFIKTISVDTTRYSAVYPIIHQAVLSKKLVNLKPSVKKFKI